MATGNRFPLFLSRRFRMVLAFSFFIFLMGIALGYGAWRESPEEAQGLLGVFIATFQELTGRMEGTNRLVQAGLVFVHNLRVTVIMFFFGGILPFFPLMVLGGNGAAIGMMAGYFEYHRILTRETFFLSLLPHGIFELTAILFAATMGVIWGVRNWLGWLQVRVSQGFLANMKSFLPFVPWVIFLLILAAVIEILVSPVLLSGLTL